MEFRILVGTVEEDIYGNPIINGLEFGNEKNCIAIKSVQGLETPPIRNNVGDWSGRDGGYISSQLYSARIITIQGYYWDPLYACDINSELRRKEVVPGLQYEDDPYSVREKMTNYLKIRQEYPIFIKFLTNRIMFTYGYLMDIKMDYDFVYTGEFQLTFYCPGYELSVAETYGDPESVWRRDVLHKEIFGGHLVPETLAVLFKEGRHPTIIDYEGLIPCYPIITLKGPSNNPTFLNTATNKYLRIGIPYDPDEFETYTPNHSYSVGEKVNYNGTGYECIVAVSNAPSELDPAYWNECEDTNFSMAAGQTLIINMAERQVLLNGKSISMQIDPDSDWWYLQPGQNRVYFLSQNPADSDTAEIKWTTDFQGC